MVQDVSNLCSKKESLSQEQSPASECDSKVYPLQLVAVDIVGPLTPSKTENTYILVASDYFTRWVEAYAIPNQEAVTVANKLVDEFFCRFSVPEQLHSDQGRQFEANVMQEVCRLLQIDKTRTTPYHPQSDGLVERFNRTMLAMLASTVEEDPSNWEQHLRKVCMAYNTSVQPSTVYTPFYLMFGRLARLPVDIMYGNRTRATSSVCKDIKRYTGKCSYEGPKTHAGNSHEIRRTVQQKSARGWRFGVAKQPGGAEGEIKKATLPVDWPI